jgi:hypothetical protein
MTLKINLHVSSRLYVCLYVFLYVSLFVCMFVCMFVCLFVNIYHFLLYTVCAIQSGIIITRAIYCRKGEHFNGMDVSQFLRDHIEFGQDQDTLRLRNVHEVAHNYLVGTPRSLPSADSILFIFFFLFFQYLDKSINI